jgi:chaperonin GroEL (HSP60 family)
MQGRTANVLLRGGNKLVLEEAERSLHDALCVIRCLVQKRALITGRAVRVRVCAAAAWPMVRPPPGFQH